MIDSNKNNTKYFLASKALKTIDHLIKRDANEEKVKKRILIIALSLLTLIIATTLLYKIINSKSGQISSTNGVIIKFHPSNKTKGYSGHASIKLNSNKKIVKAWVHENIKITKGQNVVLAQYNHNELPQKPKYIILYGKKALTKRSSGQANP